MKENRKSTNEVFEEDKSVDCETLFVNVNSSGNIVIAHPAYSYMIQTADGLFRGSKYHKKAFWLDTNDFNWEIKEERGFTILIPTRK